MTFAEQFKDLLTVLKSDMLTTERCILLEECLKLNFTATDINPTGPSNTEPAQTAVFNVC